MLRCILCQLGMYIYTFHFYNSNSSLFFPKYSLYMLTKPCRIQSFLFLNICTVKQLRTCFFSIRIGVKFLETKILRFLSVSKINLFTICLLLLRVTKISQFRMCFSLDQQDIFAWNNFSLNDLEHDIVSYQRGQFVYNMLSFTHGQQDKFIYNMLKFS